MSSLFELAGVSGCWLGGVVGEAGENRVVVFTWPWGEVVVEVVGLLNLPPNFLKASYFSF